MLDCLRVPQQCHYYEHGWVVIGCGRVQEALQVHGEKLRKRVLQDSQCLHRKANGPVLMLAGVHVAEGAPIAHMAAARGAAHAALTKTLAGPILGAKPARPVPSFLAVAPPHHRVGRGPPATTAFALASILGFGRWLWRCCGPKRLATRQAELPPFGLRRGDLRFDMPRRLGCRNGFCFTMLRHWVGWPCKPSPWECRTCWTGIGPRVGWP